jgi:hypothetical protein
MTREPKIQEILENLQELAELNDELNEMKMTTLEERDENMINNEDDLHDEVIDNQGRKPMRIANIKVITEPIEPPMQATILLVDPEPAQVMPSPYISY